MDDEVIFSPSFHAYPDSTTFELLLCWFPNKEVMRISSLRLLLNVYVLRFQAKL